MKASAEYIQHQGDLIAAMTLANEAHQLSAGIFHLFGTVGEGCYRTLIVILFELLMTEVEQLARALGVKRETVIQSLALALAVNEEAK